MKEKAWRQRIKKLMDEHGIDALVDSPAVVDAARAAAAADAAWDQFVKSGGQPVLEQPNTNGHVVLKKNPLLLAWADMKSVTLAHWRELCLTPKSYRQSVGEVRKDPASEFIEAIEAIEKGEA